MWLVENSFRHQIKRCAFIKTVPINEVCCIEAQAGVDAIADS